MEREKGFYWVKYQNSWTIAQFMDLHIYYDDEGNDIEVVDCWNIVGDKESKMLFDSDFDEIENKRINWNFAHL